MSGVWWQSRCAPQLESKNILFSANSIIQVQPALQSHNHFLALKNSLETVNFLVVSVQSDTLSFVL